MELPLTPLEFARQVRDRFVGFTVTDVTKIFADLRLLKTPYERKVLTRSFEISAAGQLADGVIWRRRGRCPHPVGDRRRKFVPWISPAAAYAWDCACR